MGNRKKSFWIGLCILTLAFCGCGNSGTSAEPQEKESSAAAIEPGQLTEDGYILDDHFAVTEVPQLSADPSEDPFGYLLEFLSDGEALNLPDEEESITVSAGSKKKGKRSIQCTYSSENAAAKGTMELTLKEGADSILFYWKRDPASFGMVTFPDTEGCLKLDSGKTEVTDWHMTEEDWENSYQRYLTGMELINTNDSEEKTKMTVLSLEEFREQNVQVFKEHAEEALRALRDWIAINRLSVTLEDLGVGFIETHAIDAADLYENSLRLEEIDALSDSDGKNLRLAGTIRIKDGRVSEAISRNVYDEENRLIRKEIVSSSSDHSYDTYTYAYDKNGNLVRDERWTEGEDAPVEVHTYEYDEKGRETGGTKSYLDLVEKYTSTYTEDPDKHTLEVLTHHSYEGEGTEWDTKEIYDAEGNILEKYVENEKGILYRSKSYEYDEHGNETADIAYNEDGSEYRAISIRKAYEYDESGRMTAEIYLPNSEDESEYRYEITWDEFGNRMEEGALDSVQYYDRFGNSLMDGKVYRCYELPG